MSLFPALCVLIMPDMFNLHTTFTLNLLTLINLLINLINLLTLSNLRSPQYSPKEKNSIPSSYSSIATSSQTSSVFWFPTKEDNSSTSSSWVLPMLDTSSLNLLVLFLLLFTLHFVFLLSIFFCSPSSTCPLCL